MPTRRDFLVTSAGLVGATTPFLARSQVLPCPPPQLSVDGTGTVASSCQPSVMPAYISSMAPFQVRSMSGSYAPSNGSSTLRSVMPAIWANNDDIMRPWSGGAKSTSGTKMYVHGGGHGDSHCNVLASFDFAGSTAPAGWVIENAGQPSVTSPPSVGSVGPPVSVHTYDGMVDAGDSLYRFGGSTYPQGSFTDANHRFSKSAGTWTRIPSGSSLFGSSAIVNQAAGKILVLDRWVGYYNYAFYRIATNNWSATKNVSAQWVADGVMAFDPATNTGLILGGNNESGVHAFSLGINWSTETITQTARSITNLSTTGAGPSLIWDSARGVYWTWGWGGQNSFIYEINPSTWVATQHALTGNAPLSPESGTIGSFGRFVFLKDWRAIGSVSSRSGAAFVIKLPA